MTLKVYDDDGVPIMPNTQGTDVQVNTGGNLTAADFQDTATVTWSEAAGVVTATAVGAAATQVTQDARTTSGTITKGSPAYITGWNASGWVEVAAADANGAGTMPALGIAGADLDSTSTNPLVISGVVSGINTSSWAVNDALYVSETVGTLTNTRPTGASSDIQAVARVLRSNVASGVIQVIGAGRSNDVPNITDGKFWVGNASNVATEVNMSSDATMDNAGAVTIANDAVSNAKLANVKEYSLKGKASAGTGDPTDMDELDITTDATPVSGDFLLGWKAAGTLRKFDVSTLPAGSEANNLAADGVAGIADDQLAVGTGVGTAAYQTLPNGVVKYDTTAGTFSLGTEGGDGTDTTAIHDDTSGEINAVTVKASPVGADVLLIEDSAASFAKKKVTISTLPAGSEINDLASDGINGIADDQLAVGTGVGTAAYQTLPNGAVSYSTAGGTFSQASSANLSDGSTLVANDQANTYSTGAQDFSAATSLTVPTAAGAAPTASGQIAYDSTANQLEYGDNATNRVVANLDEAQTLTNKTLTTPTIGDFTNSTHNHQNAAGGGTLAHNTATDNPTTAHGATGAVMGTTNTQTVTNKDLTDETNKLRHSKSITIEDPADGDRLAVFMNERAITVLGVSFASLGGTSVLFNVEYATTIASGTVIHTDTCATSTPEWDVAPSGTTAVPTDQIILIEITTVTGSVTDFHVTIEYDET